MIKNKKKMVASLLLGATTLMAVTNATPYASAAEELKLQVSVVNEFGEKVLFDANDVESIQKERNRVNKVYANRLMEEAGVKYENEDGYNDGSGIGEGFDMTQEEFLEKMEKEAAEQAAKEKAEEQAAKDKEAAEKAAKDKEAAEQAAKDKEVAEKDASEQAAKDKEVAEKEAKEKAEKEAAEQAAKDKEAAENKTEGDKPSEGLDADPGIQVGGDINEDGYNDGSGIGKEHSNENFNDEWSHSKKPGQDKDKGKGGKTPESQLKVKDNSGNETIKGQGNKANTNAGNTNSSSNASKANTSKSNGSGVISSENQTKFIDSISKDIQAAAKENNTYASIMIAQAILATGYGKSSLASTDNNNIFGIKGSYNGASVSLSTGSSKENFRKYDSKATAISDYINLMKNASFYSGAFKSKSSSYDVAAKSIGEYYAVDKEYANKLISIIKTHNLTQYDK